MTWVLVANYIGFEGCLTEATAISTHYFKFVSVLKTNEIRNDIIRTREDLRFSPEQGRSNLLNCPRLSEWKQRRTVFGEPLSSSEILIY
jgi:hypothetical protein